MKKLLILTALVIFLHLTPKAQEAILATNINGTWYTQNNYVTLANSLLPGTTLLAFDSMQIDPAEQVIYLFGHTLDSNQKTCDRILGLITGAYMHTKYDSHIATVYKECTTNDCCIICKKTAAGTCYCYTNLCERGNCDERTFGTNDLPSGGISNAIRAYLN